MLKADARFRRSGTLDRIVTPTSGNIRFFRAATPGVEIMFNGTDNVFSGNQLSAGVRILAEGRGVSSNLDDVQLTLTLTAGSTPVGPPASVTLTAVSVTLDISPPRATPGSPFTPLPQPPDPPPAAGTPATDKWFGGAMINTQDPGNNQLRAELIVAVSPTAFAGILVLKQVRVSATNTVLGLDNRAELFDDEIPGPRQTPLLVEAAKSNPLEFNASAVPNVLGLRFFVEGRNASTATRDTGFQLGVKNVSDDGDRIALTVPVAPVITVDKSIVVVKKPHTNPVRRVISIRASTAFARSGTLTRSAAGPPIRLLDQQQPAAGNEIVVTGAGHTFSAAQLSAGLQLFAESTVPSGGLADYQLTLTLAPGPTPIAAAASVTMTAVELTLEVALSRPSPGVAPALMSANDKINTGRFVQVRDPAFNYERAMIILRPPSPAITLTTVLTALNAQVQAFGMEAPAAGQAPHLSPATFPSDLLTINAGGLELFVEGTAASAALRDTGFQLGIEGLEVQADRVAMTSTELAITELATPVAPALAFCRFGLWDNAYDAAFNVVNAVAEAGNFVGADKRKFHFRVRGPGGLASVSVDWKTLNADRVTDDDAPAPAVPGDLPLSITLPPIAAGSASFISRGLMLVTDDTDRDFPTDSGLNAPFDTGLRNIGKSNHRTRRAKIDGFVHVQFQPAPGQSHRIVVPVFDRAVRFTTTSATNVAVGTQVITPTATSGTAPTGARWSIKVGSRLTIDTGANQEEVVVTAVTVTTFTANFTRAHNGTVTPFAIAGTTDERRRVAVQVIRYLNPANPAFPVATPANIAGQFQHANDRWNQVACQIDPGGTVDRQIPVGALNPAGLYGGSANNAFEQAALSDLIPITPDNTATVVFVAKNGSNAYATTFQRNPIPQPVGPALTLGDRHFIFINAGIDPAGDTLAHELHHVLFNRGDNGVGQPFFTFNTNPSSSFGLPLPNVTVRRRVHNFHTADPDNDPNNDNVINWVRRVRTIRFPLVGTLGNLNPAADATTGNRLNQDF